MISDEALLKLSWAATVVGLIALFLITELMQTEMTRTTDITDSMVGKEVSISGRVKSAYQKDSNLFLTIEDSYGTIKAVWFDAKKTLEKNSTVKLTGRINKYNGELEIIIEGLY